MICLTLKPSQKTFRDNWTYFYGRHQAQTLTPLDYTKWSVLDNKTKQKQLPIQILVRFRLLLRSNGIKYQKNLFWSQINRLAGVLIQ